MGTGNGSIFFKLRCLASFPVPRPRPPAPPLVATPPSVSPSVAPSGLDLLGKCGCSAQLLRVDLSWETRLHDHTRAASAVRRPGDPAHPTTISDHAMKARAIAPNPLGEFSCCLSTPEKLTKLQLEPTQSRAPGPSHVMSGGVSNGSSSWSGD